MSYQAIETGLTRDNPPPIDDAVIPRYCAPSLAVDAHFHVFGPHQRFPFASDRTFTPHDVPMERVLALHERVGFQRGVIVQSACHRFDHSAVIDALAARQGRYKAVALLPPDTPGEEIARLDALGFCGVRFHYLPHLPGSPSLEQVQGLMARAPAGWHAEFHVTGHSLLERAAGLLQFDQPVVIDHMGRFDIQEGLDGEAFVALRRLLDSGRVWVKLSGIERLSRNPWPYEDAVPFAKILAEQAPERVLWGTDFPHPNLSGAMPNDAELVDLIPIIVPEESTRQRMLVDNPAELFGFTA